MGIPLQFCDLIKQFVKSISYLVIINSEASPIFAPLKV